MLSHHPLIILKPDCGLLSALSLPHEIENYVVMTPRPVGSPLKKKPLSSDLLTKDSRQSVYSLPSPPLSHVHTSGMVQNDSFCFEKIHAIILKSSDSFHQQLLKTYKVPRCRGAGLGGSKRGKRYSFLPLLIFFYFKSIKLVILQGSFIRQSFLERGRGNKLCLSSSSLLQH